MGTEQHETIGQLLKKLRSLMGLTLRQVEETIGVSNAYLSQLENDKIKHPSTNTLYKLAGIYCVEIDLLLIACGIIKSTGPKPYLTFNITSEEEKELLKYLEFLRHKNKNTQQ